MSSIRLQRLVPSLSCKTFSNSASLLPRVFGIRDKYLSRESENETASHPLLNKLKRKEGVRVTVTGAAGAIGYSLVYRICNGELLGNDIPIYLSLLELPQAMNALAGVAMELDDCAFPLLSELIITDDASHAFDGCEIALMVGSKPRQSGMERADLLRDNGHIFQTLGQVMNRVASRYCRTTVVGNPCNTNCMILANNAPDLPLSSFTAMTRLDHNRAVSILSRKTQLPVNEINYSCIWGNHSSTMLPDIENCTIHGVPWKELIGFQRADRFFTNEFMPKVQERGARIIAVRGSSSAASAANACLDHTRDWMLGSPQPDWTSMAVVSNGEYGVPHGLVFSYPVWCKNGALQIVSYPTNINEFQQFHMEENIRELENEKDMVSSFLPN